MTWTTETLHNTTRITQCFEPVLKSIVVFLESCCSSASYHHSTSTEAPYLFLYKYVSAYIYTHTQSYYLYKYIPFSVHYFQKDKTRYSPVHLHFAVLSVTRTHYLYCRLEGRVTCSDNGVTWSALFFCQYYSHLKCIQLKKKAFVVNAQFHFKLAHNAICYMLRNTFVSSWSR